MPVQTQVWRQQRIRIDGKVVPRDVWGIPGTDRKKSYGWIGYLGKRIMVRRGAGDTVWSPITDEELGTGMGTGKGKGKGKEKGKKNGISGCL